MVERRQIGDSGLSTPPLVLGGNVFGAKIDEAASFTVIDAFVAGGGAMIDTADFYSAYIPGLKGGESETVIGNWHSARGRRADVLIATKVGLPMNGDTGGLRAPRIAAMAEDSLRRLRTDYIDLYYVHRDDLNTPIEEMLEAFDRLVGAGKVRAIAGSNYTAERLSTALDLSVVNGWAVFCALQPEYNLLSRADFEAELQKLCVDRNIAALPYFGLASGFLTGKYRSAEDLERAPSGGFLRQYMNPRGLRILAALDQVAEEVGGAPAEVALAWLAAQPGVVAPLASARNVEQLAPQLASMHLALSAEQIALLTDASEPD